MKWAKKISRRKIYEIFIHAFLWTFFIVFAVTTMDGPRLERQFVVMAYAFVASYINVLFLVPVFLSKKKYLYYTIGIFTVLLFTVFLLVYDYNTAFHHKNKISVGYFILFNMMFLLFYISLTSLIKITSDWITLQEISTKVSEIEKEKVQSELTALYAQINPHFLFNCLNNIYSLALDESKKTPDAILKLSEMMGYMIYDCKGDCVALDKEIQYIQNYIELQQLRLNKPGVVQFNVHGNTQNVCIAPLLLIPLIENCFKHGITFDTENVFVLIDITVTDNELKILLKNSKPLTEPGKNVYSGIGLNNVQSRLKYLYPNKHNFTICTDGDIFAVEVKIQIAL